jgi:hypothetical protein
MVGYYGNHKNPWTNIAESDNKKHTHICSENQHLCFGILWPGWRQQGIRNGEPVNVDGSPIFLLLLVARLA